MQLSLFQSLVALFPSGSWSRPANRAGHVVLFVPCSVPLVGLGSALRKSGCVLRGSQPLSNGVALLVSAPALVSADLLSLPRPMSHGSQTEGVMLPW